jgi:Spy/CpxP family protein refolding chaperone
MAASVQEDLGLSDKQKEQLKRLEAAMRQKGREAFTGGGGGGGGGEGFDPQAMMTTMNALRREHDAAVSKVLDKRQRERLAQLELQREGVIAVTRKDLATKLKLTSSQNKKVKAIVDEMRQSQAQSMPGPPGGGGGPPGGGGGFPGGPPPGGGGNRGGGGGGGIGGGGPPPGGPPNFDSEEFRAQFAKMREAQDKIRTTATEKIDEVLTKDQKASFDKMLGKPFDFSTIRPGPGPGGPPDGAPPSDDTRSPAKAKTRRGAAR